MEKIIESHDVLDVRKPAADADMPKDPGVSPDKELREYSKDYHKEERKEAAKAILEKRKEHFNKQDELSDKIRQLRLEIAGKKGEASQLAEQVELLDDALAESKRGLISRILDRDRIEDLENQLGIKENDIDKAWDEIELKSRQIAEIERLLQDESQLEEARAMIGQFYEVQLTKHIEYLRETDVQHVMREHDVVFVHGIQIGWTPNITSNLSRAASPITKIQAAMVLKPDLSCSTISEGDTASSM